MISRSSSGSSLVDSGVEPTRSQNMTVSWRRWGLVWPSRLGRQCGLVELGDRAQYSLAMTERDPDLQVRVG